MVKRTSPLVNRGAFHERHTLDESSHARPHVDAVHGFEMAGELVGVADLTDDGHRDGYLGRRRGRGCLAAAGEAEGHAPEDSGGVDFEHVGTGAGNPSGDHWTRLPEVGLFSTSRNTAA
jgi:hypothetical protein